MTDVDKRMLSLFGGIIAIAVISQAAHRLYPSAFEDEADLVPQPAGTQVIDVTAVKIDGQPAKCRIEDGDVVCTAP